MQSRPAETWDQSGEMLLVPKGQGVPTCWKSRLCNHKWRLGWERREMRLEKVRPLRRERWINCPQQILHDCSDGIEPGLRIIVRKGFL